MVVIGLILYLGPSPIVLVWLYDPGPGAITFFINSNLLDNPILFSYD